MRAQHAEAMNGAAPSAPVQMPGYGFDMSRAYLPFFVVLGLMIALFGTGWKIGGWYQDFSTERSAVLVRLDTIERKLDLAIAVKKSARIKTSQARHR